ncbi:hypothetical protein BGZ96_008383, partial [Linnemannia gamsii]
MRATTDHSSSLSDNDTSSSNSNSGDIDIDQHRRRSMSLDNPPPSTSHHQERTTATDSAAYSSESTTHSTTSGHHHHPYQQQQQHGYYDHSTHHNKNHNNSTNGHSSQYDHYNNNNNNNNNNSSTTRQQHTPSPPPPQPSPLSLLASSATEVFQGRSLPPIEPSHPLHSYMSNSRRGSLLAVGGGAPNITAVDPEYHHQHQQQQQQQPYSDKDMIYRRPSITVHDASSPSTNTSPLPPTAAPHHNNSSGNGHYYNSSHGANGGSISPGTSGSVAPPQAGGVSPTQLRHAEIAAAAGGRRESLPSIHSSAGPLGQLFAQEPPRRHSIAHHLHHPNSPNSSSSNTSDPILTGGVGPLKRKSSGTRLSQVHLLSDTLLEHPAKRRDSIPDASLTAAALASAAASHSQQQGNSGTYSYPNHAHHQTPGHHHHIHHGHGHGHGPYPPRSSFSAPSSPPRRGSIAAGSAAASSPANSVPALNLQPPADIKSSPVASSSSMMEYGRPHYPLHQPRRPSLLSESGSRRSSVADLHNPYSNTIGGSPSAYPPHEYDHRMNMDMERLHLSSQGPEPVMKGGVPSVGPMSSSSGTPLPPGHLYPGYNGTSPTNSGSNTTTTPPGELLIPKGDTPYSRSPELRVSHKLAERKRRKEMKELFDELRDSLPVDRSLKTSKWEILSKAVDFIASMKDEQDDMAKEIEALRQE